MLPSDGHVHSEWSWDAFEGSMESTCRRAVALGLPSVAFTEHADFTAWTLGNTDQVPAQWRELVSGGVLVPPALDLDGYLACLEACRARHSELRILSGVELSEPHWHTARATALLGAGRFERVLASVHSAPTADGSGFTEVSARFGDQEPGEVLRGYLAETARLVAEFDAFEVLAHLDYPVRYWPKTGAPYDPLDFQEEYRHVLRGLAASGKVLELNTRVPLGRQVLEWWYEEGGRALAFGSDAHDPGGPGRGFRAAARTARAAGFRPGRDPWGFWCRG
ncbi:PHP domain-containing protein [Streptomyces sp. NPDC087440]|uniref:PHP domain-containing protein n=1 Tax=Streptomyces sp. NPDC087440 TaxID=3365790 RepID=UPI0037F112B3